MHEREWWSKDEKGPLVFAETRLHAAGPSGPRLVTAGPERHILLPNPSEYAEGRDLDPFTNSRVLINSNFLSVLHNKKRDGYTRISTAFVFL